jgi:hypothetical protein
MNVGGQEEYVEQSIYQDGMLLNSFFTHLLIF